jgi:hypothetical protein
VLPAVVQPSVRLRSVHGVAPCASEKSKTNPRDPDLTLVVGGKTSFHDTTHSIAADPRQWPRESVQAIALLADPSPAIVSV